MNRRQFALRGLAGFAALERTLAQSVLNGTNESPTPQNLAKLLPSPIPGPGPCGQLPELPRSVAKGVSERLLPGFSQQEVASDGATIRFWTKGEGPPLLLIHGHPETHVTWHKVAPKLAETYTVVLPDLRGYGDSSKPPYSPESENYSFRKMAEDQIAVMTKLGHQRFMVAGHDRGGRVVHRLCLDHPDAVRKASVLDIAPTLTMYNDTSKEFATKYVWWFLQIQPAPMPEHLISMDPVYYLRDHLAVQGKTPGAVTPDAMAEYIRCYSCTGTIRAVCEDYRAAAGIDLADDKASDAAGQKIKAPLLALWGAKGTVGKLWDVIETWKARASGPVTGRALRCGHLLPEEQPDEVLSEFQTFFV